MNREIKFNLWDIEREQYYRDVLSLENDKITIWATLNIRTSNNVIWLQFTGLKDKNGKEIFEGDIVRCDNMTIAIEYSANAFEGIYLNPKYMHSPLQNKNYLQWEVIGNIYQNPELL